MYVTQMIEQVPHAKRYSKRHLENVAQMLQLINEIIGRAPEYNETGLVGVPLNAVLDWCMGTPAGFAAFRHPPINAVIRKILRGVVRLPEQPRIALRDQRLAAGMEVRVGPEVDKDRGVSARAR